MTMKLFDIKDAILNSVEVNEEGMVVNTETGEAMTKEEFAELCDSFSDGIENLCLWIKDLKAEAKAIKEEKMNLAARQTAAENKAARLENFVAYLLAGAKFKTPKVVVSYRTTHPLVIEEGAEIPAEYWKQAEPTLDKIGLTNAVKAGVEIPGCHLGDKVSMTIK